MYLLTSDGKNRRNLKGITPFWYGWDQGLLFTFILIRFQILKKPRLKTFTTGNYTLS